MLDDAVEESTKSAGITKGTRLDRVKDGGKLWVELVVVVQVGVAEVFDVFGKVTKEEDVLITDFARDFDLANSSGFVF